MPIKTKKYYADIPNYSNYLISNYGEVIKKSTWKKISVISGTVILTTDGIRTKLTINKLLRELFTLQGLPISYSATEKKSKKAPEENKHSNNSTGWRSKLTTEYVTATSNKVNRNKITAESNNVVSKYEREESFLQFVNRLRDTYGELKLTTEEEAAEWLTNLHSTFINKAQIPKDHIY